MAQDDPSNDIRITPGGMVSAIPAHLIGLRGSTPYRDNAALVNGFANLVSLNGQTAVPFANTPSDSFTFGSGSLLLGGPSPGSFDCVDVARQNLLSQIMSANDETSLVKSIPVFNSEGILQATAAMVYGAYQEPFVKSGTGVTVTAGSNVFAGNGGTTWNVDLLLGGYGIPAANLSLNLILPGDVIGVNNAAGTARTWFRILAVPAAAAMTVFPTPTAGNPAIGANRDYIILRTGYGGYSRGVAIQRPDLFFYFYYAGTAYNFGAANGSNGHGVLQAFKFSAANTHQMAPETVDALGVTTGFPPIADDVAYYKGFLLYGADTAVSWSRGGFPFGLGFTTTDFPASNITVVDPTSRFVSFEYLGDQLIAIFEESIWLISATGSIPEFAFYRLPEILSVQQPSALEPCGIANSYVRGRPSTTGRGAVFYQSNRGIEQLSGGLSQEASAPIQNIIARSFEIPNFSQSFLSWSDDFDLLWVRPAWGETGKSLVYCPGSQDWSIIDIKPPQGRSVVAITAGVPNSTRQGDLQRRWHVGYYETLFDAGVVGTNGGNARTVNNTPDGFGFLFQPGLQTWLWRTPIIPAGLRYPDFSLAGFLIDAYTTQAAVQINWVLYGGISPYNMFQRDAGGILLSSSGAQFGTAWLNSRARLGKKVDDPFLMLELSGAFWVQLAGIILFNANTQVKR